MVPRPHGSPMAPKRSRLSSASGSDESGPLALRDFSADIIRARPSAHGSCSLRRIATLSSSCDLALPTSPCVLLTTDNHDNAYAIRRASLTARATSTLSSRRDRAVLRSPWSQARMPAKNKALAFSTLGGKDTAEASAPSSQRRPSVYRLRKNQYQPRAPAR